MRSKKITPARLLVHRSRCLWWHAVLLACIAPFSLPAAPQPDSVVVLNEVHYNPIGADFQVSEGVPGGNYVIDAQEVTRILTFWRAGGYHVWPGGPDAEHPDGFAPGPGTED